MKRVLYTGLTPPKSNQEIEYVHCPLIKTVPRNGDEPDIVAAFSIWPEYSHVLFTSKTTVPLFLCFAETFGWNLGTFPVKYLAVGRSTAFAMEKKGLVPAKISEEETSEGILNCMRTMDLSQAFLFWPHSSLSRRVLPECWNLRGLRYRECILYETHPRDDAVLPPLDHIDEIFFTSPSTVDAFLNLQKEIPNAVNVSCIGPITENYLKHAIHSLAKYPGIRKNSRKA